MPLRAERPETLARRRRSGLAHPLGGKVPAERIGDFLSWAQWVTFVAMRGEGVSGGLMVAGRLSKSLLDLQQLSEFV